LRAPALSVRAPAGRCLLHRDAARAPGTRGLHRRDSGRPRAVSGRRLVPGVAGVPARPHRSHPPAGLSMSLKPVPEDVGEPSDDVAAPILRATGIHKAYLGPGGRLPVLCGVDFEVARGTLLAIVGASGSGKSTLLNILGTLDR